MNKWQHLIARADAHRELWFDCVRIYLGLALLARGLLLVTNTPPQFFVDLLQRADRPWLLNAALLHYIIFAHLIGGTLLTIGLLTRLAALIQIPILAGAVFIVHRQDGLFAMGQNLELSALVLFLLVIFVLGGAGRLSVDHTVFGAPAEEARHPVPQT